MENKMIVFGFLLIVFRISWGLEMKNGAYEDLVIKVTEAVPVKDCRIVLDNLQVIKTLSKFPFCL